MRILIGDDQIEDLIEEFTYDYRNVLVDAQVDYTANPQEFVQRAASGNYDALLIDLRWGPDLPLHGYDILQQVQNYAPKRILWTSESKDAREQGYQFGATHCLSKSPLPSQLEDVLFSK